MSLYIYSLMCPCPVAKLICSDQCCNTVDNNLFSSVNDDHLLSCPGRWNCRLIELGCYHFTQGCSIQIILLPSNGSMHNIANKYSLTKWCVFFIWQLAFFSHGFMPRNLQRHGTRTSLELCVCHCYGCNSGSHIVRRTV